MNNNLGGKPAAAAPAARRISAINRGGTAAASGLALPANVIRLPRGPEKGKGFQNWCKARMDAVVETSPAPSPRRVSKAIPIVAPPKEENEVKDVASASPASAGSVADSDSGADEPHDADIGSGPVLTEAARIAGLENERSR